MNMGYVVGLLPVTGVTLPLISAGGTSLVLTLFVVGMLANAARHEPEAIAALRHHGQGRLARLLRLPPPRAVPAGLPTGRRPRRAVISLVVAGGGSAGHIEPALALADAVLRLDPSATVTALGTERGLDTTLIPARGYALELIPPVPLPAQAQRRPAAPARSGARGRAAGCGRCSRRSTPTSSSGSAATSRCPPTSGRAGRVPIVVHEANARAGLANRVGARFAARVAAAVPGSLPGAEILGMPLRRSVTALDRPALRAQARAEFGLPADGPTLLVFGGSQGARTLNTARRRRPARAGGGRDRACCTPTATAGTPRRARPRATSGWPTSTHGPRLRRRGRRARPVRGDDRRGAVGRRAARRLRPAAARQRRAGAQRRTRRRGGRWRCWWPTPSSRGERVLAELVPLLTDPARLAAMGAAARRSGHADAAERLAHLVLDVGRRRARTRARTQEARRRDRPLHRHRRRGDERHRPHPAGQRGAGHRLRRPGVGRRAGAPRAGRARCTSGTTRRTCPSRPPPSWCPPRSGRATPSSPPPASAASPSRTAPPRWPRSPVGAGWPPSPAPRGKTSTTSMLTVALQHCGLDPSFAIGGDLATSGSGAHEGTGDIFVVEADESDASFLAYSP